MTAFVVLKDDAKRNAECDVDAAQEVGARRGECMRAARPPPRAGPPELMA